MELITILLIVAGAIMLFASYYSHTQLTAVADAQRKILVALQGLAAMLLLLAGFIYAGLL